METIVLQTHNVGEADRFCILFTKEKGKLAARARGVRKLTSRFGGSVLPLSYISAEIREGSAGFMITGASRIESFSQDDINAFMLAQQGLELLISTLQDEEALPEVFDATLHFLRSCSTNKEHAIVPFTLQLLHLYGLLPNKESIVQFGKHSDAQIAYMEQSITGDWDTLEVLLPEERKAFSQLCSSLLSEISTRPLQTGMVMKDMRKATAQAS
ncbi:DNA repair protein RecO [Candidatus Peregrinibacteria bacterium]|nr:DNA repair protein RecO [Candidatus Peregrinibacteria bacterium]MBT5468577.1 DNA repair protein RecO [Candidatus Peregrinibacteria bacterium]MBT7337260.1 DNA repair protein RecO [Candidatus Peregrinibacteria bacterium]